MKWKVIDSLVSPSTSTIFSCVISAHNLKLVLWYKASLFMEPGDELTTSDLGVFVNNQRSDLSLYNVSPFNAQLWKTIREKSDCPGNQATRPLTCNYPHPCKIERCPYGLKKTGRTS